MKQRRSDVADLRRAAAGLLAILLAGMLWMALPTAQDARRR